jgi:hypothetical protein
VCVHILHIVFDVNVIGEGGVGHATTFVLKPTEYRFKRVRSTRILLKIES